MKHARSFWSTVQKNVGIRILPIKSEELKTKNRASSMTEVPGEVQGGGLPRTAVRRPLIWV